MMAENHIEILLGKLKSFLEKIDRLRDQLLFVFIKPYWPRIILPNYLTIARIIIALLLFFLLFNYEYHNETLIIVLFFIGALTDLLDGSVARCLGQVTKIGTMIDPVADRLLILPIAVYSLISEHAGLLYFLLLLETINTALFVYTYRKNILIASNIFGKTKMVFQSVVFAVILLFWPETPGIFFIYMLWLSACLLALSILFRIDLLIKGFRNEM